MSNLMKLSICMFVACLSLTACSDSKKNPTPASGGGGGGGGSGGGSGGSGSGKSQAGCLALVGKWECTDSNGKKTQHGFKVQNEVMVIETEDFDVVLDSQSREFNMLDAGLKWAAIAEITGGDASYVGNIECKSDQIKINVKTTVVSDGGWFGLFGGPSTSIYDSFTTMQMGQENGQLVYTEHNKDVLIESDSKPEITEESSKCVKVN